MSTMLLPMHSARRCGVIGGNPQRRRAALRRARKDHVSRLSTGGANRCSSRCSRLAIALIVSAPHSAEPPDSAQTSSVTRGFRSVRADSAGAKFEVSVPAYGVAAVYSASTFLSTFRVALALPPPAPGPQAGLRCPRLRWPAWHGPIRDPPRAPGSLPVHSGPP